MNLRKINKISRQRGNALFLILIAVALFAALSYAITQSSRGGSGTVDKEKDAIMAAQILQIGSDIRAAATRLRVQGLKPADIHLHDPADPVSPCTQTDGTCLFTPEGGGTTWPQKLRDIFSDPNVNYMGFFEVGEVGLSAGLPSIAMRGVGHRRLTRSWL